MSKIIFETRRLTVRKASTAEGDINFFVKIWTNPKVMINVGFPTGLKISRKEIYEKIANENDTEFDKTLIVGLKESGGLIGVCKLVLPNEKGISQTDIKLLPQFWGNKYGLEIKRGLIDYLFTHTECIAIEAWPNKDNIASQKMQEAVGGIRVDEGVYKFPEKMRSYTVDVPYYLYRVYRKDWDKKE